MIKIKNCLSYNSALLKNIDDILWSADRVYNTSIN